MESENQLIGVTILFDQYGHPNQQFWVAFFRHLSEEDVLKVKGFADEILIKQKEEEIFPLKIKSRINKISIFMRFFPQILAMYRKVPLKKMLTYPLLATDRNNVIHLLNAQRYPGVKKFIQKKKLIFSFRGYETLVRPKSDFKWLECLREIYHVSTKLHFVSSFIKNRAIELGAPPSKCVVIYRSVDLAFFQRSSQLPVNSNKIKIITIGRLTWQKGYLYALECIKNLKQMGFAVEYHVVGEGADHQQLIFHRDRLGLSKSVVFHGQRDRKMIKDLLHGSFIYFHPSVTDALPNAILEASAMELPVVSTIAGGIPEAVIHEKTGLLSPVADVESLTRNLAILIENPQKAKEMGKKGRDFMENQFHPDREIKEWVSLYKNVFTTY